MRIKNFLPYSRSYKSSGSRYFPEPNWILINGDEIKQELQNDVVYLAFLEIYSHELHHSRTSNGDIVNRTMNSLLVCNEIFSKKRPDLDFVINLEFASQILHKKTAPIEEALLVYILDEVDYQLMPYFKNLLPKNQKSVEESTKEMVFRYWKAERKVALSDKKVAEFYEDYISMKDYFDDLGIPLVVAKYSRDIPYPSNPQIIIEQNSDVDISSRFHKIWDFLKSNNSKMPKTPKIEKNQTVFSRKVDEYYSWFDSFLSKIPDLHFGRSNFKKNGHPKHFAKLHYPPKLQSSNFKKQIKNSRYYRVPVFQELQNSELVKSAFNSFKDQIWFGLQGNDEVFLLPNVKYVPEKTLDHWLGNFVLWFLKEQIIGKEDVGTSLAEFPTLHYFANRYVVDKARKLQQTMEIEKAHNYEGFKKIVKEN